MRCKSSVYKMYDRNGELLYIGVSSAAVYRFTQHMETAHWSNDVAKIEIDPPMYCEEAIKQEKQAIKELKPKYNIAHSGVTRPLRTSFKVNLLREDLARYKKACKSKGTTLRKEAIKAWEAILR